MDDNLPVDAWDRTVSSPDPQFTVCETRVEKAPRPSIQDVFNPSSREALFAKAQIDMENSLPALVHSPEHIPEKFGTP